MKNTGTILDQIVERKLKTLCEQREIFPLSKLIERLNLKTHKISTPFLFDKENINFIAEIKRFSPSKGALRPDLDPIDLANEYMKSGAAAISVLTEEYFFKGSLEDLRQVKKNNPSFPVLRKDFIVDEYQVYEAKLNNADIILLIAAVLEKNKLKDLSNLASELGMSVLFEVHDERECEEVLSLNPLILGVNNRNLKTFDVSLETSFRLIQKYKSNTNDKNIIWVSESGISEREHVLNLATEGFKAFLVGESLLKSPSPAEKLKELSGKN